jgi:thymidylate synthase
MSPSLEAETKAVNSVSVDCPEKNVQAKPTEMHEEHQYLDLIREILETGEHRPDRYVGFGVFEAY